MVQFGYTLSGEEHRPNDLVRFARLAEDAGFEFASISDHFHPWIDRQGQSVFVWAVIGGIAQATDRLRLGTGVTCPTIRTHPAIIAHAAATAGAMMPGRFYLGVGSGENLNEHILGDHWPEVDVRHDMLEEAVAIIRQLWQGGSHSHSGRHYTVQNARIYTLPEEPVPIMVAASGPKAAALAGKIGDGFIGTSPKAETLQTFDQAGGRGKPKYGQATVCWAADEASARKTALEIWPNGAIPGELGQELPQPAHFEQAAQLVTEEHIAEGMVCGPDAKKHIAEIQKYIDAGYDHVYIHQIGPDQEGFLNFYQRDVLPAFK
ncbi:MAG: TIGR03557 family F420-dependent LLM class oxidoreductase [Chloroflexota bacterium]|nr:TIGR03557 family F420-dependent LLM class oxidoreductase [Chloroflexota bacterium]